MGGLFCSNVSCEFIPRTDLVLVITGTKLLRNNNKRYPRARLEREHLRLRRHEAVEDRDDLGPDHRPDPLALERHRARVAEELVRTLKPARPRRSERPSSRKSTGAPAATDAQRGARGVAATSRVVDASAEPSPRRRDPAVDGWRSRVHETRKIVEHARRCHAARRSSQRFHGASQPDEMMWSTWTYLTRDFRIVRLRIRGNFFFTKRYSTSSPRIFRSSALRSSLNEFRPVPPRFLR